ncbi:MAG: hypothetical protein MUO72_09715 [Bacteroidales bacterium]|nr:hypothetical protein [Bacteroidales bacterium]
MIYRDTIIEVHVPGHDTVFKESTIRDTIIVHSGTAHGRSWVIHDTIKLMVWQTDTILSVKLDSAIKVINDKNTLIYTIKQKTKFERYLWLGIVIAGIILLIVLVPRVLKKK